MTRAVLLLGCAAACAGADGGRLTARLERPRSPERHFDIAVRAKHCGGGRGVLLEAASEGGDGVLVWLRGDTLAPGEYPLRAASDSGAGRAATVSLRYMSGDIAHGVALDSGLVRLSAARPRLAGDLVAHGTELAGPQTVSLSAHFANVAIGRDTTTCMPS